MSGDLHVLLQILVMAAVTAVLRFLPFLMFHGTEDGIVSWEESRYFHDALVENGGKADLYLVEGAHHADCPFFQEKVKDMILEFIHSIL